MSYGSPQPPAREDGAHAPFMRAVRAHPLLIAAIVLASIATSVAWLKTRTPKYEATAQILVTPVSNDGSYAGLPVVTDSSADPARTLQTAATIVQSPQAAAGAVRKLGAGWSLATVGTAVDVQPRGESDIIAVTGTASHAVTAAALANAYAESALAVHASTLSEQASTQVSQLEARAKSLAATDTAAASQIASQLTTLASVADGHDPNFSLLQAAPIPTAASGPSAKLIVLLAIIAGLVIGTGAATAVEYLNRRVRDEDELLALYPLPVLARVPNVPSAARDIVSPELLPPRVREAFRTLQVQLARTAGPVEAGAGRAIMFTSPSKGDGKTASAVNFALMLAAANFRVILFDFDLRKPDLGNRLRVRADFRDFFRTNATLDDLLVESRAAPNLRVISARPQGDVTPLLEAVSRRLPELLREARKLADYVIVDTAPLGPVSDALRVALAVDDIILVARPGSTDRTELQHTRELLERMGHTPTGLLIVGSNEVGNAYEGYGLERNGELEGRLVDAALAPSPVVRAGERGEKGERSARRSAT